MKCKIDKITLSGYIDKELSFEKTKEVAAHIADCPVCQEEFLSLEKIKKLCQQSYAGVSCSEPSEWNQKLFDRLEQRPLPPKKHLWTQVFRYAALLLFTLGIYFYNPGENNPEQAEEKAYPVWEKLLAVKEAKARKNLISDEIKHKEVKVVPNWKYQPGEHIKNLAQARLTSKEQEFLLKQGFVVTTKQFDSFTALYSDNHKNNIPSFVTMDTAISGLSHILAGLRVDLEQEIFLHKLTVFTKILREELLNLEPEVPPSCKKALFIALSFIKIASVLLDCDGEWPASIEKEIEGVVKQELALIYNYQNHHTLGIQKSPLWDYDLDYNKFKIRWNETQDKKLRNYYLAMEWYSRCVFRTSSILETQTALLLLMASLGKSPEGDAVMIWDEMNQLLTALYGRADDPDLLDYLENARNVFGDTIQPSLLTDQSKIQKFCREINHTKLPQIRSETGLKGGLRIFGGRYSDRDMILQQFCNPSVGDKNDPRIIPSVLDIAVIMNHPKAMEIAKDKDLFRFSNYSHKISSYQKILRNGLATTSKPWEAGGMIGDIWIYQTLMDPQSRGYPHFCRSDAWESRKLTTLLCGLVSFPNSKPTYTGQGVQDFNSIVDPYPEFFNRILTNIKSLEKLLSQVGYPPNRPPSLEILAYKKTLEDVVAVSEKMLSGESLTQEDQDKLSKLVLGWQGNYEEANINELSTLFHRNETQCDFYFHAGVEPIRELWILCPAQHISFVARGGVYILYEFTTEKKVLPEKWRQGKLWEQIKKKGMENVAPWSKDYVGQE